MVYEQKKLQPENPFRVEVLRKDMYGALLIDEFVDNLLWMLEPPRACPVDILRVHESKYFSDLEEKVEAVGEGKIRRLDCDTVISTASWEAAMYAVGSVTYAVDQVLKGNVRNAFCLIRPPGHHAGPTGAVISDHDKQQTSNGFCLFNNIAIGAAYAKCVYRKEITRVAIVDFDVHHGNGT
jgi:acetoin utilization deacetylase AcuC-like enzyme